MVIVGEVWKCMNCEEIYDTEERAQKCKCKEVKPMFECGDCGDIYEEEYEAEECCEKRKNE